MFIKLSGEVIRQIRFVQKIYLRLMSFFKKCRNFVTFIKVSGEIIRQIRFVRRVYLRLRSFFKKYRNFVMFSGEIIRQIRFVLLLVLFKVNELIQKI